MPVSARGGPEPARLRRALFIDRDGTLNPDLHYLKDADRLETFRGIGNALGWVHDHGWLVICVTNQSGVERGFYTIAELEGIHARLNELLRRQGTSIDAFYYCPHAPERGCACRKPGTELFERARTDFRIDLATSAIVGDRALDAEAGRKLGLLVARIRLPGLGAAHDTEFEELRRPPDITADSVEGAVTRILARG